MSLVWREACAFWGGCVGRRDAKQLRGSISHLDTNLMNNVAWACGRRGQRAFAGSHRPSPADGCVCVFLRGHFFLGSESQKKTTTFGGGGELWKPQMPSIVRSIAPSFSPFGIRPLCEVPDQGLHVSKLGGFPKWDRFFRFLPPFLIFTAGFARFW